jgi:signal peptidase II
VHQVSGRRREEEAPRLNFLFYLVIAAVLIADQLTKYLALHYLAVGDTYPVVPNIFHLTLVHNTGIAFGFFRQHPQILLILISFSLLFLFFWGTTQKALPLSQHLTFGMILGGAVGNWIDRIRFGAVIDFLDFRVWPVFNIADSAITVGVTLLAFFLLRKKSQ